MTPEPSPGPHRAASPAARRGGRSSSGTTPPRVERERVTSTLLREWDQLADGVEASPFVRPGWIVAWWRSFGRGELEVFTLRDGGRLSALVPLEVHGSTLRSPTNYETPEFEVLAEHEVDASALVEGILAAGPRRISLADLEPSAHGTRAWRELPRRRGYRDLTWIPRSSPYVELDGDSDRFEERPSAKRRRSLRARRRQLEELGAVELDLVRPGVEHDERGAEVDGLLDELFDLEGSGWKDEAGTSIRARPDAERFYREVGAWAASRGWLELAFLAVGGRRVAGRLQLRCGSTCYLLKTGYDPDLRRGGPGMLLGYLAICDAQQRGVRRYELLGDASPAKLTWTDLTRDRLRIELFDRSLAGTVQWGAFRYAAPRARRVRRALDEIKASWARRRTRSQG